MAAPPRPKRVPDLRPATDYGPVVPRSPSSTRWLGLATGAASLFDPFVVLHDAHPWWTPWSRDRYYLAHDLWSAIDRWETTHPGQGFLFDPDILDGE